MLKVFNRRRPSEIPQGSVYVGRPTQWGNPFSQGSKAKNIADFEKYACERIEREPNWLDPLKGKHLVCWCSPAGCHGDILIKMANEPVEVEVDEIDWDAWADQNAPEDVFLDNPSDWEVQHGLS